MKPKLQELVPKTISKNDVLRIYRIVPKTDDTVNIANKIRRHSPSAKKRYLDALALESTASHATIRRRVNHFREKQNIRIKLSQDQAKLFAKVSTDESMESDELATKIISEWISRKT